MRPRRVRLPRARVAIVAAITALAVAAGACGEPPDKEIQQAQGAIDAAKAAGADVYARDEFTAAQEALRHANEAVAQRDYRLALNNALDARERAQNAAKEAGDRKAAVRADAERALTEASNAVAEAHARLNAAETARVPPRILADQRHAVAGVEQSLQKARAAIQKGDYLGALETTRAAIPRLQAVARNLETASAGPARRRR
jgi:hypothetical protein